eukprot:gnl/TRDRNA2_/TRDRNA2_194349_c0_seq1.p1 gnl/TRDRNA2_/TRDRNA2_194349_c0~~gnl/TRDRNA2_/TRDRNA2_194349_c0_seq1.p1  ORF type:complete len:707 (+),score=97.15 gnl/TRDRNA2_/TRDRNA2_194349_c0_seq1:36-2156(+)
MLLNLHHSATKEKQVLGLPAAVADCPRPLVRRSQVARGHLADHVIWLMGSKAVSLALRSLLAWKSALQCRTVMNEDHATESNGEIASGSTNRGLVVVESPKSTAGTALGVEDVGTEKWPDESARYTTMLLKQAQERNLQLQRENASLIEAQHVLVEENLTLKHALSKSADDLAHMAKSTANTAAEDPGNAAQAVGGMIMLMPLLKVLLSWRSMTVEHRQYREAAHLRLGEVRHAVCYMAHIHDEMLLGIVLLAWRRWLAESLHSYEAERRHRETKICLAARLCRVRDIGLLRQSLLRWQADTIAQVRLRERQHSDELWQKAHCLQHARCRSMSHTVERIAHLREVISASRCLSGWHREAAASRSFHDEETIAANHREALAHLEKVGTALSVVCKCIVCRMADRILVAPDALVCVRALLQVWRRLVGGRDRICRGVKALQCLGPQTLIVMHALILRAWQARVRLLQGRRLGIERACLLRTFSVWKILSALEEHLTRSNGEGGETENSKGILPVHEEARCLAAQAERSIQGAARLLAEQQKLSQAQMFFTAWRHAVQNAKGEAANAAAAAAKAHNLTPEPAARSSMGGGLERRVRTQARGRATGSSRRRAWGDETWLLAESPPSSGGAALMTPAPSPATCERQKTGPLAGAASTALLAPVPVLPIAGAGKTVASAPKSQLQAQLAVQVGSAGEAQLALQEQTGSTGRD